MEPYKLKAPFSYFGGKSRVADVVWKRFGDAANYVEPFAGSLAVLLSRPHQPTCETVNDINGFISNFWRAIAYSPKETAHHADWPVNENDLHARHVWLVQQKESMCSYLEGDPEWHDAKIAGWWCWGMCCWIGSGFCDGKGPWWVNENRQLVYLGDQGRGVHRQTVHLGDQGRGVNRQTVHLGDWFADLSARLRRVRVCCGDWSRVCGETPTIKQGTTAVFLDPPYNHEGRDDRCYGEHDDGGVAEHVREWALERANNPQFRIALCGYEGEHDMPGWECFAWKTVGGYASQGRTGSVNADKERIWFSPHCLKPNRARQLDLYD